MIFPLWMKRLDHFDAMASCRMLVVLLCSLSLCFIPSAHSQTTELPVDNVLFTEIVGLPLVEQQITTLSTLRVMVGTTNVINNGIETTYPGPFRFNYTLASGSNSSNAMELLLVQSETTFDRLSPGTLYPHSISNLAVPLTDISCETATLLCVEIISEQPDLVLTESTKGCIQISCRGVVITFIDPAELEPPTTLKQGTSSNSVSVTVSFDSDPNYASVSGTNLWDPLVFGNGNQFGTTSPMVTATPTLVAVSDYGIDSMATSVWPEMTVAIDLSNYGCPEARFICVNPRRHDSSSASFTLGFIPQTAQYGCVEVDCAGVEFIDGSITTTSEFAEFRSMHEVTFSASFMSDSMKGGVNGQNLWRVKAYASMTNETGGTPISETYADITGGERNMDLTPGDMLQITNADAVLDLSSVSCSSLIYLCVMAERNPDSMRNDRSALNFAVNSYVVCQEIACTGLHIDTLTLAQSSRSDGSPLVELVPTNPSQNYYVDLTINPRTSPPSGGVIGADNWMFDVFLSDMADCTTSNSFASVTAMPAADQTGQNVDGMEVTIQELLVVVDISSTACSMAPYLCLNLSLSAAASSKFRDVTGDTSASFLYACKGIEITQATVALTPPSASEITERASGVTFTVDLTVTADSVGGSTDGRPDLWTAIVFFSTDRNGSVMALQTDADSGSWQNTAVMSGQTVTLMGISATIDLASTCAEMRYLCVQLNKNENASFTFDVNNNKRVACTEITRCHGVEIAETVVAIQNPTSVVVIENTPTSLTAELNISGVASALTAPLSGSNLWNLNVFTSSNGMSRDGGVNFLHGLTPLQADTPIITAAMFDFTTTDTIDVTFNMTGNPCDLNNYLCVEILAGDSPSVPFTLDPMFSNTTGCAALNCRGIIVTDTNTTITAIPNGGVLVEGFPNQAVDLMVSLTTNSMGAQGSGTGLWQLDVFTNALENGTGQVKRFETTLTSGSWIDTNVPAGSTTPLVVPVMVDLSGQLCMDVSYLCARIREGVMPMPNITLQYSTGPENFVGCAPVTCESAGIERNGMSFTPGRVVENQVAPELFDVSVSYISEPGRDNITGTNLWSLRVFFSDSENGTNPSAETEVDLGALADAPFYSGRTLDFNGLAVNVSLNDFACYMNTHFCTQLGKGNPNNNDYTLEIRPECMPIQCAGIALNSTLVTVNNGQLLFEYQSSQSSDLDVTLNSLPEGASVEGNDLWNFTVFLSNSDTMFTDRVAVVSTNMYTSSSESPLVAGTPITISGVQSVLDLQDVGCIDFSYICVQVTVGTMAMPPFNLDLQMPNADIGCASVNCRGVLISSSTLNLINGEPLIERVDDHQVTFAVDLQISDESTDISGTDLWQATLFTNTRINGGGARCASSPPIALDGNITRGQLVSTENAMVPLNIAQCTCSQMQYLCVLITMNPGASVNFTLENPSEGRTICQEVECTGVVINGVDVTFNPTIILYEARPNPNIQNVTANVVLSASNVSAVIEQGTVTNIWQLDLFPRSNPSTDYRFTADLTPQQANQGLNASDTLFFNDILFEIASTLNFVCPEGGREDLCVEVSTQSSITENITIAFLPNGTDCVSVECRGVIFDGVLNVAAETDTSFVEFESMHRVTFNISADTTDNSTTIDGVNLWQVRVYGSLYMNGTGERFSESQIPIDDANAAVTPGTPVEYTNLMWDMDLTNFTCPNTNQFFMCVQLMPGNNPNPRFSMSPRPLITCVEINCTGVVITTLDLTVNSGDPILERNPNSVDLTVMATSSLAGSSISGNDLWNLTILLCERDQCASARRRRRGYRNSNSLLEVTANLTPADIDTDLPAGGSITFPSIMETLDLTSVLEACPSTEMVYICVQLDKREAASPDFTLQGELLTCQAVQCRGVHIQSSSTANQMGTLQEGNPSNNVELDFIFTADTVSANISGTNLWDLEIYGSDSQDGGNMGTIVTLGDIGSTTNSPLSKGETIEFFRVMTTLDLSPYITCDEAEYVCGRLVRRSASSQMFSVTGERTACVRYECTGVQVSATTVEVTNDAQPTEGQAINLMLNVTLAVGSMSSNLSNVTDAWLIEVFGNSQSNGLGAVSNLTFVADTTSVGNVGAMPGMSSVLDPVSVNFDLSTFFCENINYLCIEVKRGTSATPPFKLQGVPSDFDGLFGCTAVDCIGVRINSGVINTVLQGNPVLQGDPAFEVEIDVDFTSDMSGADVSGTDLFGVNIFLSIDGTAAGIIGNKSTADIPQGTQSTTLTAGGQLNIQRANATISTEGLACQTALYICAELFSPASASYLLNGYNSTSMMVDDSVLIACEMIECRDVRFDDMTLSVIDAPCVIERTANQMLVVNVTVQPNSTWSSVSGTDLWMMNTIIRSPGQMDRTQAVALSTDNANRGVDASAPTTFPNVELSLDLNDYYCPDTMVELCVSISPNTGAGFSLSMASTTEVCMNVPCKVTEIESSDYEIYFPSNILEYRSNDLRLAVLLTAAPVSAAVTGDELWQIVRVYMSSVAEGNDSVAMDTTVPLLSSQDNVGISPGGTAQLLNIEATLNLESVNCASMPYLCVEVAKGDAPTPEFNVSFNNNSNIICKENVRCQGIVITNNTILNPLEGPDAIERMNMLPLNITVGIEHDPNLGTSTDGGGSPWDIMVFYNDQSDCQGNDFGSIESAFTEGPTMLVDGQPVLFENLVVNLDLRRLICPSRNVYLCTDLQRASGYNFTLNYDPPSARYAVRQVPCHGVEISGTQFTLTDGIQHEQYAPNHEITFDFKANTSETSAVLFGMTPFFSFLVYGSRNEDGSGARVINEPIILNPEPNPIGPEMEYDFFTAFMLNLSFDDIECVDMKYLCIEIQKYATPRMDFSLWGIPDDLSLRDCFELDCRGVYIEEFNVTLTPGDEIVYENNVNMLTAVDLSLSSRMDKENATGTDLWEIFAFFSDMQDGTGEEINRTKVMPLPNNQVDQDFLAGQQIGFGPLDFTISLTETCENVMYLCFELQVNDMATGVSTLPVLLGERVSCLPVDCRGVLVANTNLQVTSIDFIETVDPIRFDATAIVTPHPDSADISGSDLWSLGFYLSTSSTGNTSFARAPAISANEPLSVGNDVTFTGLMPEFNASEVLCYEASYLCMVLRKNTGASPDFGLSGFPDDGSLIGCTPVTCIGVVVSSTVLNVVGDRVLLSGEPNLELGPLSLSSTFASQTRNIPNGNNLFSIAFIARSTTGEDTELTEVPIPGPSSNVESSGMIEFLRPSLMVDLTGIRCDQMASICGILRKGSNPNPDYTLQGQNGEVMRLEDCFQPPCRGVQVDSMFVNFVSGVPLLEDTASHEVNFTLTVGSDSMGADALGDDLWSLTTFLSRYANGSNPISRMTASIGGGANMDLQAGDEINIAASVNLNTSDVVCSSGSSNEFYLCVILSKGDAVNPDYTLEGVGTLSDLQVCRPYTCQGVNLTNAGLTFSSDNVLRNYDPMSEITADVTVDVLDGSATVSGSDLWHFEFFTSTDSAGNVSPTPRSMATDLSVAQGSVSLVAGATSTISGVNVTLDLSDVSCSIQRYLCVEVWRGQRALPFYTINLPASQSQLRACEPIECVGVQLVDVTPTLITPPIWIERLSNQSVALEIALMPNTSKAGIMGLDLFEVDVFASASNTGMDPQVSLVTVPVTNDIGSNREVNRFNGTTLVNVQAELDFSNYDCSSLMYICIEVRKGPNAVPDYLLSGPGPQCVLQPCAGVIVNSVTPTLNLGSDRILEEDAAHTFTFSAEAVTGNGIVTNGTEAWQLEVFVSLNDERTIPLRPVTLMDLTAPSVPNSQIEFSNLEATVNLSGLMCNEFRYFCTRLSAPGADFTLRGAPTDSVLLGCTPQPLTCSPMNSAVTVEEYTDTTLTVEWMATIGDFDSYFLSINPREGNNRVYSQIKSVPTLMYTFTGLTPGENYTVALQLTKSGVQKGAASLSASTTLLPSCPALDIGDSDVTSMEITVTWSRPLGYVNVQRFVLNIMPNIAVTYKQQVANPFTDTVVEASEQFSSLTPAQSYEIEVRAVGNDLQRSIEGCNTKTIVAKPATVILEVNTFDTTSVSLAWDSDLTVTPTGYMLTIDIFSPVPDAAPAPIDVPGTDTAYVVSSLLPGVEYEFTVQAYQNISGKRAFGDADTETQRTTPVPPENIGIGVTENTATITYQAPSGYHSNFTQCLLDENNDVIRGPDGSAEFSIEYVDLTPGTVYTYRVLTNAGDAYSDTVRQTFTTRPNPPGVPQSIFVDENTITIEWAHNVGLRDNYEVTYYPNSTSFSPESPHDVIENTFTITNLDPYTTIEFEVRTVVNSVTSTPSVWRQRSFATRPNMIRNLMIVTTSASSVNVMFEVPDKPNGLISGYLIVYNGARNTATISGNQFFSDVHPNDLMIEVPISNLNPGFTYQFSVQAVNEEGTSDAVIEDVTLLAGDPVPSGNGINTANARRRSTSTTITFVISADLFSDMNGDVIAFQVFVAEEHASNTERTIGNPPLRYQEVVNLPFRLAYVTSPLFAPTPFTGNRKRRQIADTQTTFIIGDERECVDADSICNGPLEPLTSYRVLVRAYTDGGFADSPWSEPISTTASDTWFTIPVIVYGVVIFFILLFMVLCCLSSGRHRRKKVKSAPGPRKTRGFQPPRQESRFNDNHNNSSHTHPKHRKAPPAVLSRPILSDQFAQHYNEMIANKQHKFTMEFDDLRNIGQDLSKSEGKTVENRNKNRFGNILPYNETRVQLSGTQNYINANYITGFTKPQEYIATQGPMSNTVNEFWRMVWEKESPCIVMLVRCIEGGKEKSDKYWPVNADPTVFGKVIVTKLAEHTRDDWAVRDFRLKVGSEERLVRQYHFIAWPTHSTPRVSKALLGFVRNIREEMETAKLEGPMVVHCGAGIGRTGVFIALDILMQEMKADERTVDVFAIVAKMRRERCTMVQSLVQYIFLHRALADYLQGQGHAVEASSIERSDAGSIQSDEIEEMSNTSL